MNYSYQIYLEMCEKGIESILTALDLSDVENYFNVSHDKYKKTMLQDYIS